MISHESREESCTDAKQTASPIKVRWSGDAHSKLRTRKLQARLADGAEAAARAMDRQKTQVVAETEAEAIALEEFVAQMAETKYRWTTEGHLKAFRRVRDELQAEMESRGWGEYGAEEESVDTTDDLLPEWTAEAGDCPECGNDDTVVEHEDGRRICAACDAKLQDADEESITESAIEMSRDRFECFECGFAAEDRDDFATVGLAMACPECQSLRVEHVFTDDDLVADGGFPTCDSCGERVTETIAGPGEARRSCGCPFVPEFDVPADTENAFANAAIRAANVTGDVETAALIREDARGRLVTDGGRQPVEKMSVDELCEEYHERADIGYSDPEDHDRKMALWNELRGRVDVEQPKCPECGERNWGQAPGEPKKCNACGNPLDEPKLAGDIQQAWNEIMHGDGNELVTDGGKPTLALTDDGLEIPEGVSLSDGVVVRARGATVDHKPGSEEQSFYPMIDQRHLHAEWREAVNDQLADDEVTVKQYGEDAEAYRVVIPETDGGTQNVDAWGTPSTREALLEHLRREVAESGLLRCKARRIADDTQLTTQTVGKYLSRFSAEEPTRGVEVTVFHDRGVATVYEIAPAEEVDR